MTTDEWHERLTFKLEAAQPAVALFGAYYAGQHRLQFATSKFREAFGELFEAFATNWCALVVDVCVERLAIQGFRFGEDEADEEAWSIWQANGLDARSITAHTQAVKTGASYLLIGPPAETGGEPVITVEHPSQVTCIADPADQTTRQAALKWYVEDSGDQLAVIYEPDLITTKRRKAPAVVDSVLGVDILAPHVDEWDVIRQEVNPLGIVPVVPIENNPGIVAGGISDLVSAVPLNDAANKFFTDMIHASEFTSFPQRVLTGVELPRDPVTGEVVDEAQLRAAVSRLWAFEDPDSKVFDLSAASLTNYVEGIDLAVQHIAAQTRTPPQYLLTKLANISGDALLAAESGLVARVRRKQLDFSEPWEEALRLAFAWRALSRKGWVGSDDDYARSLMTEAETIWANPESRNPSVVGDELVKKQQIGVPQVVLWEEAGYSPQQIRRMVKLKAAEDAAKAALEGQTAAPAGVAAISQASPDMLAISGLSAPAPEKVASNGAGTSEAPQEEQEPPA